VGKKAIYHRKLKTPYICSGIFEPIGVIELQIKEAFSDLGSTE
jgi:hypothetical protein